MTLSTKPEVRKRRTEPWPQVKLYRKLGEICTCGFSDMRVADRHTDMLTTVLRPPTRRLVTTFHLFIYSLFFNLPIFTHFEFCGS